MANEGRVHVEVDSNGVGVPFTQYTLPHGAMRDVITHVPAAMFEKVQSILDAGYVFECEVLSTGIVSLTITDRDVDDFICVLAHNNRDVLTKVQQMIADFDVDKANARREYLRNNSGDNGGEID